FSLSSPRTLLDLHSFPTRRSSDLTTIIAYGFDFFFGKFDHELRHGHGHLGIRNYQKLIFVGQRNSNFFALLRISHYFHIRKEAYNLLFHLLWIDIPYNDDGLQIWTVPFFMKIAEHFRIEIGNNLLGTYRQTLGV